MGESAQIKSRILRESTMMGQEAKPYHTEDSMFQPWNVGVLCNINQPSLTVHGNKEQVLILPVVEMGKQSCLLRGPAVVTRLVERLTWT